jgi:hypothetical protein
VNGTANGFFGSVDISGWFSDDFNSSNIDVIGQNGYDYTFTGPLNGAGYTQTSQIPPTPCIIVGCIPSGPGQAGIHLAPINNNLFASLEFEDTGELYTGVGPLVSGLIFDDFQGGTSSAPVSLAGPGPVAQVTGSISEEALENYYSFQWMGGAFSATGSVTGAPSGASYVFSAGVAGTCASGGSTTLNSGDSFTSTITIANLAAGEYCIGLDANNPNDPAFDLTFNTPVTGSSAPSGVPEPSGFVLLSIGSLIIGGRLFARRSRRPSPQL